MTSIGREIVNALYGIASENSSIRLVTVFFGYWSGYVIFSAFLLWTLLVWRQNGKLVFFAQTALAALSSRIVLEIIRAMWDIKRPFLALGMTPLFNPFESGPSLPSGHATFYFALAAVAWNQSRKASVALFTAALLMGIGRIAAGVHWPADIIAGAIIGIAAGRLAIRFIPSS